jgi:hypothetical protein
MAGSRQRKQPEPKRSFGRRLKSATIISLLTGVGVVILFFAFVWAATEMGVGATKSAGAVAHRSAFMKGTEYGSLPWMIGGAVAAVTFLKELID